ncbi:hypothetical protein BBP40_005839 [Aspergillus hancockii]|nr:hypothetical protein BBP40_005839 [Aspergillus hancockii]
MVTGTNLAFGTGEAAHRLYDRALVAALPRYTVESPTCSSHARNAEQARENYDVVVVGAGPAGLVLSVLLARHGLRDDAAILCIESRKTPVPAGQADGLTCRSLEMFKELGMYEELLKRVMRQSTGFKMPSSPVPHMVTCPQGQVERLLEQDLNSYAPHALERGSKVVDVQIDEDGNLARPVVVTIKDKTGYVRVVRCKFLVGADGAHSVVRKCLGIPMIGAPSDYVWGVIDFTPDTDYPDIRRHGHVHSSRGKIMHFPRERNNDGDWVSRFYVDMHDVEHGISNGTEASKDTVETMNQVRSSCITTEQILDRIARVFGPFRMQKKHGTRVDWASAYAVGRRVAAEFAIYDSTGLPRVFLVGDASHTHSPKIGQGMNVSMADSCNLAWKLSHVLLGLTSNPRALLDSYVSERRPVAEQLLDIDERWYQFEWAPKSAEKVDGYLENRTKLLATIAGFTTGYGIQYAEGFLTRSNAATNFPSEQGTPRPGYRVRNMILKRFADGFSQDLHNDLPLDGHWKVLVFTTRDHLRTDGRSAKALRALYDDIIPCFLPGIVDGITITPERLRDPENIEGEVQMVDVEWTAFPSCVKREAEMKTYFTSHDTYNAHGIDVDQGKVILVRPDGVISMVDELDDLFRTGHLVNFLRAVIRVA